MATPAQWVEGARLRTLPMALAPVIAGTAAAQSMWGSDVVRALLAFAVALLLQIGVNYANDYSDGIKGTDDDRVGPMRLVGSGAAAPRQVLAAALGCFVLAMVAGVALVALSGQWWFLVIGASAVLAAWGYTGGPWPYGYRGLGDAAVFVYFGLVAVLCTAMTQAGELNLQAWIAAVATGLFACALLMANNIRDIPGDQEVGKRTLAVRLGDRWARVVFTAELGLAFALHVFLLPQNPWFLLVLLAAPLAIMAARTVLGATERTALIPVLKQCGILNLVWSVLFLIAVVAHQSL
ncbi:UNVERIFIED_CONTAM: 1,4-dihydroxy-2-naphthoate polyprenyltransferase [Kocuria sp. CPCC 205295]|uniref:1,4-dihydroxy-2-naphthoate polyprenyltransferase n=1 Tax=Kocuria TaxID=57493 RepID=UPI000DB43B80|nr:MULTISPECIES: 1,4-dihydroxy-2-naphthoate polyprenyltransferase [Kocuria]MBM7822593.1 1,4-dihydroxy-2-naphthoate octaprenyltransferase [Kocuria palustris]MCM3331090.1 1,4-dihydroxy-2-naphthoate polyprenyltransferase [Kocuria palustris]MCY1684340.1 1,4-dihydroxy-2-naphthoate polyprenyltransferase [Kocuria sp. SL71]MDH5152808.1 1,4-dihydroxy-2-naphthoate polyprenyltransferase [Kocuria palustris]PZO70247.1 MAG: 1,4-dihydroxy-2-naphthoate polyprenyltransferase [Kocuria palustris]